MYMYVVQCYGGHTTFWSCSQYFVYNSISHWSWCNRTMCHIRHVSHVSATSVTGDADFKRSKQTGSITRKYSSCRNSHQQRRCRWTGVQPGGWWTNSHTVQQIVREMRIHRSSVADIIHAVLRLKCIKKRRAQEPNDANWMKCAKKLLTIFPEILVPFIFFSGEKVYSCSAQQPSKWPSLHNPGDQEVWRYRWSPATHSAYLHQIRHGCTELMFVEPEVKVDGAYYRDVLLSQQILPSLRQLAGHLFIFQQSSAPAHRAHATVELVQLPSGGCTLGGGGTRQCSMYAFRTS